MKFKVKQESDWKEWKDWNLWKGQTCNKYTHVDIARRFFMNALFLSHLFVIWTISIWRPNREGIHDFI